MRITRRALPALLSLAALPARAAGPIRVGTLRFGSLSWELDVMREHALDRGFTLEAVEFAAGPASQIALQAGRVDIVLQDWLWVSRQRSAGADWTLEPVSAPLGAVMVPQSSPIRRPADLAGRRLGVAGGPLDKSWLLMRLYGTRLLGIDLDAAVEKAFGPPPLLAEQLAAGRLDAVLTYWPFAARGLAAGQHALLTMEDVLTALGLPGKLPMLGFVFSERWAAENRAALTTFLAAAREARTILARSDTEWQRIAKLTGARGRGELDRLRDWYRRGPSSEASDGSQSAAARLYDLFAAIGGPALVGPAPHLSAGTFWQPS